MINTSGLAPKIAILALVITVTGCKLNIGENQEPPDYPQKKMPTVELENQCNTLYHLNKNGKRISWKGVLPITFYLDPTVPKDYVGDLDAAMDAWNQAAGRALFVDKGYRKAATMPTDDGYNTIYFTSDQTPQLVAATRKLFNEDGTIAVTDTTYIANKIQHADVIFDGYSNSFSNSRFHLSSYDVQATAQHELGHVLGLTHNNSDPMSTMFFGESPLSFSLRKIDAVSQQLLDCEYK